jgi:hypothetical protein
VAGQGAGDRDTHVAGPGPHCTHAGMGRALAPVGAVLERPGRPLKPGWRKAFLRVLRATGEVTLACRKAGVSRSLAYQARAQGPRFAQLWDAAELAGTEAAARKVLAIATSGLVKRRVQYQKDKDGNVLGMVETVDCQDDPVTARAVLARRLPEWQPRTNHRHSHTHRAALDRPGARASLASQRSAALPITYADHPLPDHPTPPTNGAPGVCPGVDGCGSLPAVASGPSRGDASAFDDEFDGVGCS